MTDQLKTLDQVEEDHLVELEEELKDHLLELRRISRAEADLKKARAAHTAAAVPLIRELGNPVVEDPVSGKPLYATVIEAETLVVDAGQLYDALMEQYDGDVDQAEMVWKSVLKPPAVDTKEDGLFLKATQERGDTGEGPALISIETIAKVATFKKSAAYVSFGKPGG